MKHLHIAKDLTLPSDAATESFAILGRRGSGKTHTAVVLAEEMLTAGIQVVVIDPLDVWFGLRVSKDGKSAGFPIYVAGGSHADIPLPAESGRLLADAVVDQRLDVVLSVRHLSKSDQRRLVGEFCERLYDRKAEPAHRTALHVFIDEADAFVPQRLVPGSERCFGAVDTLVRRGRSSGLAPTLISQRPQVINKDVLSQTEVLVAHQLTGPQDRKAVEAWIEANDTEDRREEFMGSLASLPKGRAWFWSPGLLAIFKPVTVRDRQTFDSSVTPKPGVQAVKPRTFAPVDLQKLTAEIAATIEKQKADDPRELQKQIAGLKRQVTQNQQVEHSCKHSNKPLLTEADRALLDGVSVRLGKIAGLLDGARATAVAMVKECLQDVAGDLSEDEQTGREEFAKMLDSKGLQKILSKLSAFSPQPSPPLTGRRGELPSRPPTAPPGRRVERPAASGNPPSDGDASVGNSGLRRMLVALAQRPQGLTRQRLGIRSGLSSKTGTFATYLGRLRSQGWVQGDRSLLQITDAGVLALGSYDPLPTGQDLAAYWLHELGGGAARMLQAAIEAYPGTISREAMGAASNLSDKTGSFSTYLGRLRSLELIEGRGELRASEELFS